MVRELLSKGGGGYPPDQQVKEARTQITAQAVDGAEGELVRVILTEKADEPGLHVLGGDDQMVFTYRIFRQYPDILAYFQRRWPYLCVDEAQDTSKIQHAILRRL